MRRLLYVLACLCSTNPSYGFSWNGELFPEARYFFEEGDYVLDQEQYSISGRFEFVWTWNNDDDSITFTPFYRYDGLDSERTHFDIRELYWNHVIGDWDFKVGIKKVFWGVAESDHVIDVINQIDLVENIDLEDRLGQPMIQVSKVSDWGIVDAFVLLGFRERTFPGEDGRLRLSIPIDTDNVLYEDEKENERIDFALRWSMTLGDWDVGLAHFSGTSRDPMFVLDVTGGSPKLLPYYPVIDQTSIDLQATKDAWLWKLEAYTRSGMGDRFYRGIGGLEYTWYGIANSVVDLGWILEYQFDERDLAGIGLTNAWISGFRFGFNDTQSTQLLFGVGASADNDAFTFFVEASRRLSAHFSLSLEVRGIGGLEDEDIDAGILYEIRNDDYFQATLEYYF